MTELHAEIAGDQDVSRVAEDEKVFGVRGRKGVVLLPGEVSSRVDVISADGLSAVEIRPDLFRWTTTRQDLMNPLRPWNESEPKIVQNLIDFYYQRFVDIVLGNRKIDRETSRFEDHP